MNEHLLFQIDAQNNTQDEFNEIRRQLLEMQRLIDQTSGDQASRERVANIRREQTANQSASRERVTQLQQETALRVNQGNQNIAQIRANQTIENARHRERITNINTEIARERIATQRASQAIQSRRLDEQRLAREQRANFARMRASQTQINRGFGGWSTSLTAVGGLLAGSVLFGLQRVGRQVLEVTANFERLRLGITAFEGSQVVAGAQIRRVRELADLPGIGFEPGLRTVNRLRGAGITFVQSERLLREISNLASIAGGTQQDVGETLRQIQQIFSTGVFQTENLRPVFERIPQLRGIFQAEFGGSTGEQIQRAVEAQGLSIAQAFDRILTRAERSPRAPADTLTNAIERLNDNFNDLLRGFGGDFLPTIKAFVNALSELTKTVNQNRNTIYGAAAGAAAFSLLPFAAAGGGGFVGEGLRRVFGPTSRALLGRVPTVTPQQVEIGAEQRGFRQRYDYFRRIQLGQGSGIPDSTGLTDRFRTNFRNRVGVPLRSARFAGQTGGRGGRIATRIAPGGVGALIGAGIGIALDRQNDPNRDAPTRLRQEVIDSGNALRQTLILVESEIPRVNAAMMAMESEFERFTETGRLSQRAFSQTRDNFFRIFDQFTSASDTVLSQFRGQLESNYEDIANIFRDDETGLLRAYDELSGREKVRARALRDEAQLLQEGINRLVEYTDARRRELGTIAPVAGFPSGVGGAVNVVPQRRPTVGSGVGQDLGLALNAPVTLDQRRDLITNPRALADLSSGAGTVQPFVIAEQARVFGREALRAFQEITRSQISDRQRPGVGFLGDVQAGVSGGLLDPSRLTDLRSRARELTNEWRDLSQVVGTFIRDTPISEAFSPASLRTATQTREELVAMRSALMNVEDEFRSLGGVPTDIATVISAAIAQLSNSIRTLGGSIRLAQEAADDLRDVNRQLREQAIDDRVRLPDEQFFNQAGRPPSLRDIQNLPFFRAQRDRRLQRERQVQQFVGQAGESFFDQFAAPSILDAVGIGSGRSRARNRAVEELTRSIEEARQAVRENERLNARQQAEELLEINREFEREKREIERQYEQERSDAFSDWVRQQLTAFPKLIAQQLNLQLSARATNLILRGLGLGGNIPIEGGGLLGSLGGPGSSTIGAGSAGGAGGAGLAATAATTGVIASGALALHNIVTGIRDGLFDDLGRDVASPVTSFFEGLHFNNPLNDQLARAAGRMEAQRSANNLGRESAGDIVRNFSDGVRQGSANMPQPSSDYMMVHKDVRIVLPIEFNDRIVKEITYTMGQLVSAGRLGDPFNRN